KHFVDSLLLLEAYDFLKGATMMDLGTDGNPVPAPTSMTIAPLGTSYAFSNNRLSIKYMLTISFGPAILVRLIFSFQSTSISAYRSNRSANCSGWESSKPVSFSLSIKKSRLIICLHLFILLFILPYFQIDQQCRNIRRINAGYPGSLTDIF